MNVDSINSMFEITPFSSFSEFIDLQDFLVSHSKLEKYRKSKVSLLNLISIVLNWASTQSTDRSTLLLED